MKVSLGNVWFTRRLQLNELVRSCVASVEPALHLKGSFATGDFHLAGDGTHTFSDVDLVLAGAADRHAWESRVTRAIAESGWRVRVSVQTFNPLANLSSADSILLTLGELLRFYDLHLGNEEFSSYHLAKVSLRLRAAVDRLSTQRPPGIRDADLQQLVQLAQLARIGYSATFTAVEAVQLISLLDIRTGTIDAIIGLIQEHSYQSARRFFEMQLTNSNVHPWLQQRLLELLNGVPMP